MKLLFAQGFRKGSRLHLAGGIMSYLSSPLWLLLLICYGVETFVIEHVEQVTYVGRYPILAWPISHAVDLITLILAAATMLLLPKGLALLTLLEDPARLRAHGGAWKAASGVVLESVYATLLAPVMMLSHSWFVFTILVGRGVGWLGQQRSANGITFEAAVRAFAPHTVIAVAAGIAAWHFNPGIFWWYVPLLAGPLMAIHLYRLTSRPELGLAFRRHGLFLVPSEVSGFAIVNSFDGIMTMRKLLGDRPRPPGGSRRENAHLSLPRADAHQVTSGATRTESTAV